MNPTLRCCATLVTWPSNSRFRSGCTVFASCAPEEFGSTSALTQSPRLAMYGPSQAVLSKNTVPLRYPWSSRISVTIATKECGPVVSTSRWCGCDGNQPSSSAATAAAVDAGDDDASSHPVCTTSTLTLTAHQPLASDWRLAFTSTEAPTLGMAAPINVSNEK